MHLCRRCINANFAPSENPNGIPSQSPGLRGTSYPGSSSRKHPQPRRSVGVAAHPFPPARVTSATTPLPERAVHGASPSLNHGDRTKPATACHRTPKRRKRRAPERGSVARRDARSLQGRRTGQPRTSFVDGRKAIVRHWIYTMKRPTLLLFAALALISPVHAAAPAKKPELVQPTSVRKLVADGRHKAVGVVSISERVPRDVPPLLIPREDLRACCAQGAGVMCRP